MHPEIPEQVSDYIDRVERIDAENQSQWVQTHPALMAKLIDEGKFYSCLSSRSLIAVASLELAQIAYTMRGDLAAARHHLAVPLEARLEPRFGALGQLVHEGMLGQRKWDGIKLSLAQQLESLCCCLLLGRTAEIAVEYASVQLVDLLLESDGSHARAIFAKHLIYACLGRYREIRLDDYARAPVKKSTFFYESHLALLALADGDEVAFSIELGRCAERFKKRKNSMQIDVCWGYGMAAYFCFDAVGTAICRLAVQRGMRFAAPAERWYPAVFWRE